MNQHCQRLYLGRIITDLFETQLSESVCTFRILEQKVQSRTASEFVNKSHHSFTQQQEQKKKMSTHQPNDLTGSLLHSKCTTHNPVLIAFFEVGARPENSSASNPKILTMPNKAHAYRVHCQTMSEANRPHPENRSS